MLRTTCTNPQSVDNITETTEPQRVNISRKVLGQCQNSEEPTHKRHASHFCGFALRASTTFVVGAQGDYIPVEDLLSSWTGELGEGDVASPSPWRAGRSPMTQRAGEVGTQSLCVDPGPSLWRSPRPHVRMAD